MNRNLMLTTLQRIEAKLDILIAALADDDDAAEPVPMLDGFPAPRERDTDEPL